jgi:hypothetical protein
LPVSVNSDSVTLALSAFSELVECLIRANTSKAQNEHLFSVLPPMIDIAGALALGQHRTARETVAPFFLSLGTVAT